MMEGALILWFVLTFLSLIFLYFSLIYNTPEPWVMKVAWFLVVLYTGPFGLFVYLLSCREPLPGSHEKYINIRWKQAVGSEVHCLAGDATGIIIAAILLSFISISSLSEMIIEYIAGFVSGLFIFQALFMKDMMGGSYWKALKGTFMPEWLSMNVIMAGMLPVMFIWRYYDPNAADPATLSFWGSMSLATIIGGLMAYPINDWLVNNGLKHGMVTVKKPEKLHEEAEDNSKEAVSQLHKHEAVPENSHTMHANKHNSIKHSEHSMVHGKVSTSKLIFITIITLLALIVGAAIGLIWTH